MISIERKNRTKNRLKARYVVSARLIHWLMALAFLFMWLCGYAMVDWVVDDSPLQETLFSLHVSMGVTLLLLLILRIVIRLKHIPPPLPEGMKKWEQRAAHLGHLALYLLPALISFLGWAESDFGGHGVHWFGLPMPKLFPTMQTLGLIDLETVIATLHKWFAYTMLAMVVLHVAAAIKHQLEGVDSLGRMGFGRFED